MDKYITKKRKCDTAEAVSSTSASASTSIRESEKDIIEEKCENDEKTDNVKGKPIKYIQKFCQKWKKQFLFIEEKNNKPFCKTCCKVLQNNVVHIKRHEESSNHKTKVRELLKQPQITDSEKTKEFNKGIVNTKIAELRIIMFIIQNNLPFMLIDPLISLIKSVAFDSHIVKNIKCGKTKATNTINTIILEEGLRQTSDLLRKQPFSLIIDESTDISTSKTLALAVRYFDHTLGKVKDKFLNLIEIEKSDAKTIYASIVKLFENLQIPLSNIIGFAADNASVMMGDKGGVKMLLKKDNPNLYVAGCICHSINLCASAAVKVLPAYLENFVRDICSFFSYSAKRQKEFKEFQEYFNCKNHKILKLSATRWLSYGNVINRIMEQWTPLKHFFLLTEFENIDNKKAADIGKQFNSNNELYFLFLGYILQLTNNINIEFQSEYPQIHEILKKLKIYFKTILSNFVKKEFINEMNFNTINLSENKIYIEVSEIYIGAKAEYKIVNENLGEEVYEIKENCRNFYIELCKEIQKRVNFNDKVLNSLELINPKSMGRSLIPLISMFPNLVTQQDIETLDEEWRLLLNSLSFIDENLNLEDFWKNIFGMKNGLGDAMFPKLKTFISAMLSLPHSSATVERIFSQVNLVKTKTRNRLEVCTVNSIMVAKEQLSGTESVVNWIPSPNLINMYKKT